MSGSNTTTPVCYYVADGSVRRGPFSLEALGATILSPETLVWREGMADWRRAEDIPEVRRQLSSDALLAAAAQRARAGSPHRHVAPPMNSHIPYAAATPHPSAVMPDSQRLMYFQQA